MVERAYTVNGEDRQPWVQLSGDADGMTNSVGARANWNGAHVASTALENCRANTFATSLWKIFPWRSPSHLRPAFGDRSWWPTSVHGTRHLARGPVRNLRVRATAARALRHRPNKCATFDLSNHLDLVPGLKAPCKQERFFLIHCEWCIGLGLQHCGWDWSDLHLTLTPHLLQSCFTFGRKCRPCQLLSCAGEFAMVRATRRRNTSPAAVLLTSPVTRPMRMASTIGCGRY